MRKELMSQKIIDILTRGTERIIEKKRLLEKLKSGERLRVKFGIDPTGSKIHIGRAFQFWKLREFQELGHRIILIIGDFTARIGDASDKESMRKALTEGEVKENMRDYIGQISKILDMSKTEVYYNSEWLKKLSAQSLIRLSMNFTAQQLIQRRNFKERWDKGKPIGLHELDYPLLQGYDSVAVRADVEIGGFDQLFNLMTGRKVQEIFGQRPQDIVTSKMLLGTDGQKMSTSLGNIISVVDEPQDMYGKVMSIKDELMPDYFELCTRLSLQEIKEIAEGLKKREINPRDAKSRLAHEITALYHGREAAQKAAEEFEKIFKDKKPPSRIPEIEIKKRETDILDLLVEAKLSGSRAEAKRLILQRGVKINKEIQDDWRKVIKIKKGMLLQVGRRRFLKVI